MATIDQLDISIYNLYAIRTRMTEQFNLQVRMGEAGSIPPQTQLVDVYPKLTELDLLLGVAPVVTPCAYFYPPKRYNVQRRSPFAFYRVAPTLGSLDKQEEDTSMLQDTECESEEDEEEKKTMIACLKEIEGINDLIGFVIGRVGQFLQG